MEILKTLLYVAVWLAIFLLARKMKSFVNASFYPLLALILYPLLLITLPTLHMVHQTGCGDSGYYPEAYGESSGLGVHYYDFGLFPLKKINFGFGYGNPPCENHYVHIIEYYSRVTAYSIPPLYFAISILLLWGLMKFFPLNILPEGFHKNRIVPLLLLLLFIPAFIHSYIFTFAAKESWGYFFIEMGILLVVIAALLNLPRLKNPLPVFLGAICLLPVSSVSSQCLCYVSDHPENVETDKGHYPVIESLPIAIYHLSSSLVMGDCPCQPGKSFLNTAASITRPSDKHFSTYIDYTDRAAKVASLLSIAFTLVALWPIVRKLKAMNSGTTVNKGAYA